MILTKKQLIGIFIMGLGLAGLMTSVMLVKNTDAGILMYFVGVIAGMFLIEPFVGLANYIIILYVRIQEFIPAFMDFPIMLFTGAGTFAAMALGLLIKRKPLVPAPQNILMLWFFGAIVISNIANAYFGGAVEELNGFLPVFMLYLLVANLNGSERRLEAFYVILILLTIFLAGQGIVQAITGVGLAGQTMYGGERIRGIGIFSDPNDLALAMAIMLPLLFFVGTQSAHLLMRVLCFLTAAVLITAIVLTQSRGGLMTVGIVGFMLFARRFGTTKGAIIGVIGVVGLLAVAPRMGDMSTDSGGGYGRVTAWTIALDLFTSRPLFGVGAGLFKEYYKQTAHNSFLLSVSELGVFGTFPWIMLIYMSLKNSRFVAQRAEEMRLMNLSIYANATYYGLVAWCGAAWFLSRTYNELLYILIGLSVAVTDLYVRISGRRYLLVERKDFVVAFGVLVGLLFVCKAFLIAAW